MIRLKEEWRRRLEGGGTCERKENEKELYIDIYHIFHGAYVSVSVLFCYYYYATVFQLDSALDKT